MTKGFGRLYERVFGRLLRAGCFGWRLLKWLSLGNAVDIPRDDFKFFGGGKKMVWLCLVFGT